MWPLIFLCFPAKVCAQIRVEDVFILEELSSDKAFSGKAYWSQKAFVSIEPVVGDGSSLTICKTEHDTASSAGWMGHRHNIYVPEKEFAFIEHIFRYATIKAQFYALPTDAPSLHVYGVYLHGIKPFTQTLFAKKQSQDLLLSTISEEIVCTNDAISTKTKGYLLKWLYYYPKN